MNEQYFDSAYTKVKELVTKFKQGENHYLSQSYQEAEVRQDFLDDFFTALGWDVTHKEQKDPYEQEVKIEKGVKISGAQKRADYSFAIAPNYRDPKFFAEAKKPSKTLKNAQDYFQTIRYGWHKAHPLSILTDFEEFHILDCRYTPDINNSLDKCYKRFHYTDYVIKEKFAEIYWLFSREAVANNSIEKIAETLPKRKGKGAKTLYSFEKHQTIDEAFLEVIDTIREKLAKAFKKQDENLSSEQLTEATQRTVDRLVFIRFLEDKLIEQNHYVSEFGAKGDAWKDFISACRKLDAKYNGIVFKEHFIDKQDFAGPEANEFLTICQDICHLNSRFLFNEIPIHILGSIYERFLGKVVHATPKRVTVEDKPEVQKAGGVYYTPKYIVDYIVRNTVGKLIQEKTPEQIATLRFADIACGSGSFLIGVYDCLLDYHNKYYQKHPGKAKKDKCIQKDGLWVLSIQQKQKILLNNIYGVDIDQQATEVTQLSLALKLMEDETTATANEMMVLFHEKILPDMSKNIICGNSLIGTDILSQNLFASEAERKLNPMNFEDVFPHVFRKGRKIEEKEKPKKKIKPTADKKSSATIFDMADIETNNETEGFEQPHLKENIDQIDEFHESIADYGTENENWGFDVIVGNPPYIQQSMYDWFNNDIKKYLLNTYCSSMGRLNTFGFFIEKAIKLLSQNGKLGYIIPNTILTQEYYEELRELILNNTFLDEIISYEHLPFKDAVVETVTLILSKNTNARNKTKITKCSKDIKYETKTVSQKSFNENYKHQIIVTGNAESFVIKNKIVNQKLKLENVVHINQGIALKYNRASYLFNKKVNSTYKPIIDGREINRYELNWDGKYLKYDINAIHSCKREDIFLTDEKLFFRRVSSSLIAMFDSEKYYSLNTLVVMNIKEGQKLDIKFVLGVFNSKIFNWFYFTFLKSTKKVFSEIQARQVAQIPFPTINFQNKTEKAAHDKIVSLVEQMLQAKKEIKTAKTDQDKTYCERKCSSLDNAIDAEVYKLYNLSEEEIKIVKK